MLGGQLEEADAVLRRALRWHQKWPAVTFLLAGLAMTAEDFELALGFYDATLDLVPGYPAALLGRVKTLSYTGKNEEAITTVDQILEGRPAVLVENGKVRRKELAKEMLTESELTTVCHRQGFAHISEVESCVLEPGGTFYLKGKTPSADESFRMEVLNRLDQLSKRLDQSSK